MPRIFKGTETLLKLFVPRVDEGNLETLKIGLFTDDTNNAAEFYGDNMSIDGDTVYLKVNAWSFDMMNDGVLNYIAEIEIGEETIITERQSNYYLKTPNQYVPVGPDLSDYYTKPEIDEMLEDIEVDVDLTGYATEQWVRQQGYVTDSDVNDYVGNEIGQLEEIINTKQDTLISGTNIKTINGNNILGEGDITIEGGSGEQEVYVLEFENDTPTLEQYDNIIRLLNEGKLVYQKSTKGIFPIILSTDIWGDTEFIVKESSMLEDNYSVYRKSSTNRIIKGIHHRYDSSFKHRTKSGTYQIKQIEGEAKDFSHVLRNGNNTFPLSLDNDNKIASAIVGDKLYKWDFVNGEVDGNYYSPEIIPLTGGGSGGGSTIVELSSIKPTLDEFNILYESAAAGKPTYVKYNDGMFSIIADSDSSRKNLYHIYGDSINIYFVYWYCRNGETTVYEHKNMACGPYGVVKYNETPNSEYRFLQRDVQTLIQGDLPMYYRDYSFNFSTPLSIRKNTNVSTILDGKLYFWDFTDESTKNGDYFYPKIVDLLNIQGGGSTPSTETDSGVYVLDYVSEYQVMYEENNWDSVTNHVYADSERQEHNAEVYQAWKEGKVKALYYKHVENTFVNYGETLQYQLVPCSVKELTFEENGTEYKCMGVNSLYRQNNQYDPTDIQSTMFSLNEDGSLRGEYAESFQVVYEEIHICDAYYYDGEGFRLDNYVPINYIGGGWRSCEVELVYETTRERVSLNYIIKDYWTENNSTVTLYGTLSNGSIIKWDFLANNGNIIDEYAYAQIIPMEVDLSSYYTKEEVDGLIANINLGDGATIENIVANEVANQLTDNFKTINGESILGEGDITIQGGGDVDLSNYYTKEETNNLIANSGGGSGDLSYVTITSPTIVGEMTFNDVQLPHVDISESVYCNFKARTTQSKDLWVNNIHIGTNTDTVKIASPYYEATENMPDGAQEVYAEFTTTGIKEMGQYLSDKYVLKSEISATIQRLSGESLIGEEVYDFWQKNIPIWMDYQGYDRDNGDIYTAYAPLHIYKPLANGTELRVYMWITPNIYVEWNLDINDNDNVHGIITVKE